MIIEQVEDLILHDYEPTVDSFKQEVLEGLRQTPKRIPSKFFYDEHGSQLFEEITTLDEYYLTRTELSILRDHLPEMASIIGPDALVIEFGTGAGIKTRLLLEALERPAAYLPIDISREQLIDASLELIEAFPYLEVWPVCADYTQRLDLPETTRPHATTVVFFPGSTVGNFTPDEAIGFLKNVAVIMGDSGKLLIGFDRRKDAGVLEAAYDDARGVTAQFNLNLIDRINSEFGVNLSRDKFDHFASFNSEKSRIEMHLISKEEMSFALDGQTVHFATGEHIITEFSYKYTPEAFRDILDRSGLRVSTRWTDAKQLFDVWMCEFTV